MSKPRTRKAMIQYLTEHFRYDTMNSWNQAHSYAVKIKVNALELSRDDREAIYQMLDVETSWDESGFNHVLREFDKRHNYAFQIGTNGRSGGYLVLYQGGSKPSEHKSQCRQCGQRNFQHVEVEPGQCGACRAMARYNREFAPVPYTNPGKGLDEDRDFADWSTSDLKWRVDVVWDFDQTCARACKAYVQFARENQAIEETIQIPRKITVAVPRAEVSK